MFNFNYCKYIPSYLKRLSGKSACGGVVKIAGTYCSNKHGCEQCNYVGLKNIYSKKYKKMEETRTDYGEEVCSPECKIKGESKKVGEEADKKRQKLLAAVQELDQKLITEIQNTFAPFWEKIKLVRINELKKEFLKQEKKKDFAFVTLSQSTIEAHASLTDSEREQWKAIYQNTFLIDKLPSLYPLERNFLVPLAKKYKEQEEQAQRDSIPECKKCKLRREQPNAWPTGCKGWCKECLEQKQREKQTPENNNNHQPPINDTKSSSSNEKNFPANSDEPNNSSSDSDNSSSQTDGHDKREREREREREQATRGENLPLPSNQNNLQPEVRKADHTPIYLVSGVVGIIIVAVGISLVIAAKKKRKNGRRYQK